MKTKMKIDTEQKKLRLNLSKISSLIYQGRINDAWEYAMCNPIIHKGQNQINKLSIHGIRGDSGRWIVVLPIVNNDFPTDDEKMRYIKDNIGTDKMIPQLLGNRYLALL